MQNRLIDFTPRIMAVISVYVHIGPNMHIVYALHMQVITVQSVT
jgi:hypothetical protein